MTAITRRTLGTGIAAASVADPAFLALYRQMARDYAATPFKPRRH